MSKGLQAPPVVSDSNLGLLEEVDRGCEQIRGAVAHFGSDLVQSGLLALLELRLPETYAHAQRVARSSVSLARAMGLLEGEVRRIRQAALLHDIGKIAIPTRLLARAGRLSGEEIAVLRMHVTIGADLLGEIPTLADVAALIAASHERYDGTGYPNRLAGEDIPLGARVIAVADAYDAMVTRRPYAEAVSHDEAHYELVRCSGSHFDPGVVREWITLAGTTGPAAFSVVPFRRR